jgi:coenzyme F420-reducing hydrogenase beta subunit
MELLERKDNCCGCEACSAVCPHNAISMKIDEEGFLYPEINNESCVDCGLCKKVCAFNATLENKESTCNKFKNLYAVKHKDLDIRMNSRSGGIFTAISDIVLENDGLVYGAAFSENLDVLHIRAENKTTRNEMRGSKYVQSKTDKEIYKEVEKDLEAGKKVLYSGTSCQVAVLKSFLKKEYENLITVDIVCHGVPSPKVYKDYLSFWEKRAKRKITSIDFRNKKSYGWAGHIETLSAGKKRINSCIWTTLFYQHNILRPSCYICPYKGLSHPGDITIADYWGIDKALPGFSDNKGVSLVLINTEKGREYFDNALPVIDAVATDIEKSMQTPLKEPFKSPQSRKEFWEDYKNFGFEFIVKKYAKNHYVLEMKYVIKKILMDLNIHKVKR